ncbi:MAG TPA: nucleotide sugar dehydrogenase [Solirubrobacteraceae bacterium]|nr:nucleotide sugar dehydrogenase [Solirubrobacteraceae bacterium]
MTPELATQVLEDTRTVPSTPATPAPAQTGAEQAVVAVVGLGYVGLPTAIALRAAGAGIIGIDISPERLEEIRAGEAELLDSEQEQLGEYLQDGGFSLTDRAEALEAADLVLVCVPTPVDEERRPQPLALEGACEAVVRHARAGQTIVLTSTSYVGATRELLVKPLQERGLRAGEDVFVAFAPERIDPGVGDHAQLSTPRVIGGVSETCRRQAASLLSHTCSELHPVSSPEGAEMVKLYENTFRALNIALSFEIAEACREHGLDPLEVTEAAASKPFGFMPHYPSAGVGGHCIGVDPHYLTHPLRERGRPARLVEEAMRKLAGRPGHVVERAQEMLGDEGSELEGSRVLVVGVSYKPGVADCREAPAIEIITQLRREGAIVEYHDPLLESVTIEGLTEFGVDPDPRRDRSGFGPEDYDLAIVATVHPGYDYGWLHRVRAVLDCTYRTPGGRRREVP